MQLSYDLAFVNRFGTYNPKTKKFAITPKNLSLLNSLPRITFGLGIVFGGLVGERFGRRPVYILMLLICEVGTIISYLSRNFGQILAGRMLNQMYIGMEAWLVPMFHAEIVPAPIRGMVVVGYVFNHVFGSFIMSCITYKTSQWTTEHCWQIPVAMMFIIPTFALALCWLIPESPRWLLRKGNDEKALEMMRYIYGSNPEYAPEHEISLLKASLELDTEKGAWKDLFTGTNLVSIMPRVSSPRKLTACAASALHSILLSGVQSTHWPGICNSIRNGFHQKLGHHKPIRIYSDR